MTVFVLDASITMRWFFEGASHPGAESILLDLESLTHEAMVPILWFYEVSAVLSRALNRGTIQPEKVDPFLAALKALPITVDNAGAERIFSDVHRIAVSFRLTTYDAAYLELTLRRQLPLATLDNELIAACGRAGVNVI